MPPRSKNAAKVVNLNRNKEAAVPIRTQTETNVVEWRDYTYHNGATYSGQWHGVMRHGEGTHMTPDGAEYKGSFSIDRRNGSGQLRYPDGCVYSGNWHDDIRHGRGKFTWTNGDSYEGEFNHDQITG